MRALPCTVRAIDAAGSTPIDTIDASIVITDIENPPRGHGATPCATRPRRHRTPMSERSDQPETPGGTASPQHKKDCATYRRFFGACRSTSYSSLSRLLWSAVARRASSRAGRRGSRRTAASTGRAQRRATRPTAPVMSNAINKRISLSLLPHHHCPSTPSFA